VSTFDPPIAQADPDLAALLHGENLRQRDKLRMIPSENYASRAVQEACGSSLNNKYAEGYPRRRYYEGQQFIDPIEELARDRIAALFGVEHANVQPYSGSPANLAALFAFCKPGDTIMGLGLPHGGHLTHGWSVSITGSYFTSAPYSVRRDTHRIDLDEVRDLARARTPPRASSAAARRTRACGTGRPSRKLPARWARCSSPTSPTSPASSRAARTRPP
jgi:glycine hydroxymethyltransferase